MSDGTKIEWTDASWTPIRARNRVTGKVGWHCEHATPGCEHCYAEGMNKRLGTGLPFKPGHRKDIKIYLDDQMLMQPLRWKRPRMIFVCSMTDLFAEFVPDDFIDCIFAIMALCPQHVFQVLTKRPERMRHYVGNLPNRDDLVGAAILSLGGFPAAEEDHRRREVMRLVRMPLPNVWLGTSVEDQRRADERIPGLLATPAAVRFISAEPLLGPIELGMHLGTASNHGDLHGLLRWVIVGGESGTGARPMHPDWARSLRDQCAAAGVPFFFKQHGEWVSHDQVGGSWEFTREIDGFRYGRLSHGGMDCASEPAFGGKEFHTEYPWNRPDGIGPGPCMVRVGKKLAGRLLDGAEHNGMPVAR